MYIYYLLNTSESHPNIRLCVHWCIRPFIRPSVRPSVCPSVHPSSVLVSLRPCFRPFVILSSIESIGTCSRISCNPRRSQNGMINIHQHDIINKRLYIPINSGFLHKLIWLALNIHTWFNHQCLQVTPITYIYEYIRTHYCFEPFPRIRGSYLIVVQR